ncbi:MAG: ABC transporter ATP-binding protein [Bacillota bacterium]
MNILEVRNLTTRFSTARGMVRAVERVSFHLKKGEILGLIGESGCGKSTVGLSLLRLVEPPGRIVTGQVLLDGVDLMKKSESEMNDIRWKLISYIPQSAMNALNPIYSVGWQIREALQRHEGYSLGRARARVAELLESVGIAASRAGSYPHEMSGGMKQRAVIAMALACSPKVVISDEATTGLDVMTQAQVLHVIKTLQSRLGLSMLFISHDLPLVANICERIAIMYAGRLVELLTVDQLRRQPLHPYTQGLMSSFIDLKAPLRRLESIPGSVPDLTDLPCGCGFHPRCCQCGGDCRCEAPELVEVEPDHWVACCKVVRE